MCFRLRQLRRDRTENLSQILKICTKTVRLAVSEDGKSVMNARVARQAMRLAAEVGIPVFAHCEDKNLVARGVMNAGNRAKELGLYGIMNAVEDVIVARDILACKKHRRKIHLCHCSTVDSVKMTKLAKEEGIDVNSRGYATPFYTDGR
mgnify:CR=1 FL=1